MALQLSKCPVCKGTGKQTITAEDPFTGAPIGEPVVIDCYLCNGAMVITQTRAKEHADEMATWCSCDTPCNEPRYRSDGACANTHHPHKHHWDCTVCHGIVQVG